MCNANVFWDRCDSVLYNQGKTLKSVSDSIGVPYPTLKGWRCRNVFPKVELIASISEVLGTSLDFLLTGKESEPFCDEAIAVEYDEKLRLIVRQLKADPTFLEAISITLASKERTDAANVVNLN